MRIEDKIRECADMALRHDTSLSRLLHELATEVRDVEVERNRLEDESARLHRNLAQVDEAVEEYRDENAKLRELIKLFVSEFMKECGDCWGGLCDECECLVSDHADELRELGIEVDG